MFILCKILYEKNKALALMGLIGILTIVIGEALSNKYKLNNILNGGSSYAYYCIIYFLVLIIIEFKKETSIFFMPIKKKDIVKEYYIFSLIYCIAFEFLGTFTRMIVFKLYNKNGIPFESLIIFGFQEFLFLILMSLVLLPVGIMCRKGILFISLVLLYILGAWSGFFNLEYIFLILKSNLIISLGVTVILGYFSYKIALLLFNRKSCIK